MVPEGEDAVKSLIIAPKGDANSARGDNPRGLMKEDYIRLRKREPMALFPRQDILANGNCHKLMSQGIGIFTIVFTRYLSVDF